MPIVTTVYRIPPLIPCSIHNLSTIPTSPKLNFLHRPFPKPIRLEPLKAKSEKTHQRISQTKTQDDGIPVEDVKVLAKFKSRQNFIRVLEVSRKADHPLAGSRLLLLDGPGNIHSISFLFKSFTNTYFDIFATLPPILPPGPVGILGFGAGSAARLILELYPQVVVHGWELDPSVIAVGRDYFGVSKLEKQYPDRLFIYIGNALTANVKNGFSGIFVDLFSKGSLIPELQDPNTWEMLNKCLRKGGRIMVNVGGSCVEAENSRRDGKLVMEDTLKAMQCVFRDQLFVLSLGNRKDDSSLALTGVLPDLNAWRKALPRPLTASALVTSGDEKGSLEMMSESRYMTNEMVPRKEGCFECDNKNGNREKDNRQHFRKLRIGFRRAPPAPLRSRARVSEVPPHAPPSTIA